ncbi:Uncharacterised protein [Mycobacterium tuberculosis]|nr:Uncharacterised protein [Mycobacterium tuberculosis]
MGGADAGEEVLAADLQRPLVPGLGEAAEGTAVGGGVAGLDGGDRGGQFGRVAGLDGADRVAERVEVGGGAVHAEPFEGGAQRGGVGVPLDRVGEGDAEPAPVEEAARRVDGAHGLADAGEAGVGADEAGHPLGGRQVGGEGDAGGLPHVLEFAAGDPHHEVGVDEVEQFGRGGGGAVHGDGGEERFGLALGGGAQRPAFQGAAAREVCAEVLGGGGEAAQVGVGGQVDAVVAEVGEGAFGPLGAGRHLRDAGPDERAAFGEGVAEGADGEVGGVPAARVAVQAEVAERGGDDGRVAVQAGEEGDVAVAQPLRQVGPGAFGALGGGDLRLDQGADVGGARQRARVDVALLGAGLALGALLGEQDDEFGGLGAGDRRGRRHVRPDRQPRQLGVVVAAVGRRLVRPVAQVGEPAGGGLLALGRRGEVGGGLADRLGDLRGRGRVGRGEGGEAGREGGAEHGGRGRAGGGDEHPVAAREQPGEQVGHGLRRALRNVHDRGLLRRRHQARQPVRDAARQQAEQRGVVVGDGGAARPADDQGGREPDAGRGRGGVGVGRPVLAVVGGGGERHLAPFPQDVPDRGVQPEALPGLDGVHDPAGGPETGMPGEQVPVAEGGVPGEDDVDALGPLVHRDPDGRAQQVVVDGRSPRQQAGREHDLLVGQFPQDAVPVAEGEPAVELLQHDGRRERDDRDAEQDVAGPGVRLHVDVAGQFRQPVDVVVVGEVAGRAVPGPRQVAQEPEQPGGILGLACCAAAGPGGRTRRAGPGAPAGARGLLRHHGSFPSHGGTDPVIPGGPRIGDRTAEKVRWWCPDLTPKGGPGRALSMILS